MNKVTERVRRLLALTDSPNVHEAASAAKEAQRLMQEHKLTAADVKAEDGSAITELPLGATGYMASWKFALVTHVARAFFCEVIALRVGQRRKIRVVGKKDDAEVAVHVFDYLVKEIDRLADLDADTWTARSLMRESSVDVRAYKEKFRQGVAQGVSEKLKRETEDFARSGEKALVVVNRSKDELRDYLKNKYGVSKVVDPEKPKTSAEAEAFVRGYERGLDVAVPRVGGAEKYLTGEVRPVPVEPFEGDDLFGTAFEALYGYVRDDEGDLHDDDLSRGRGGRKR